MYRSVLLSVFLIFICLTVSKGKVVQKRQSQFEITQVDLSNPESLNLESIVNLAENLLKRDQPTQNRPTYNVIVQYQPYHPSPHQHFPQPPGPPVWYGRPPPPHGGPHPPPPSPHGGPHPPPPYGGPHPPPPYGGPHPHPPPPPPYGGPHPPPPPPFGGPPPHGGPPPFGGSPPNRGRPEWLPNEMTGFRPSEYDFENRPPPGFMPSPYNENPSTGLQIQKHPNSHTNEKLKEDKKKIAGYIDGDFPVILLDPDNEVRR